MLKSSILLSPERPVPFPLPPSFHHEVVRFMGYVFLLQKLNNKTSQCVQLDWLNNVQPSVREIAPCMCVRHLVFWYMVVDLYVRLSILYNISDCYAGGQSCCSCLSWPEKLVPMWTNCYSKSLNALRLKLSKSNLITSLCSQTTN